MQRPPIERASFNSVLVRVGYQLVVLNYRKHPALYAHPATGVLDLAYALRYEFPVMHWTLVQCARWLGQGASLAEWRSDSPLTLGPRGFHKRPFRPRP
jgi:hypothetical protein